MSGFGVTPIRRCVSAAVALALLGSACGSSNDDTLEPLETTEDVVEAGADDTDDTTTETTATTEAETTTEATLTELAQAEADIESVIQAWWTFPRDTSQGEAGLPLEYLTDLMYQRVKELGETRQADGQIQRSRGVAMIRIIDMTVDLDAGTAETNVCSLGDAELVDAETEEVLLVDEDQAYTGVVLAKKVDGVWKLSEFFTSQAGDNPDRCDV